MATDILTFEAQSERPPAGFADDKPGVGLLDGPWRAIYLDCRRCW